MSSFPRGLVSSFPCFRFLCFVCCFLVVFVCLFDCLFVLACLLACFLVYNLSLCNCSCDCCRGTISVILGSVVIVCLDQTILWMMSACCWAHGCSGVQDVAIWCRWLYFNLVTLFCILVWTWCCVFGCYLLYPSCYWLWILASRTLWFWAVFVWFFQFCYAERTLSLREFWLCIAKCLASVLTRAGVRAVLRYKRHMPCSAWRATSHEPPVCWLCYFDWVMGRRGSKYSFCLSRCYLLVALAAPCQWSAHFVVGIVKVVVLPVFLFCCCCCCCCCALCIAWSVGDDVHSLRSTALGVDWCQDLWLRLLALTQTLGGIQFRRLYVGQ